MIPGQTNTVSLQLVHFIAKYVCPFIDAIHWTLQREAKVLAWCEINCLLSHVYYHNCSSRQQYDSTTVTVCVYLKFVYYCSSCCSTIQEQNIEWTRLVVYGTSQWISAHLIPTVYWRIPELIILWQVLR